MCAYVPENSEAEDQMPARVSWEINADEGLLGAGRLTAGGNGVNHLVVDGSVS